LVQVVRKTATRLDLMEPVLQEHKSTLLSVELVCSRLLVEETLVLVLVVLGLVVTVLTAHQEQQLVLLRILLQVVVVLVVQASRTFIQVRQVTEERELFMLGGWHNGTLRRNR
jgi:hypothetical protein